MAIQSILPRLTGMAYAPVWKNLGLWLGLLGSILFGAVYYGCLGWLAYHAAKVVWAVLFL